MIGAIPRFGAAQEPPVIPIGLDAYRQWERWPYLRVGQQTFMRGAYDRRGGNEGAGASHFHYQLHGCTCPRAQGPEVENPRQEKQAFVGWGLVPRRMATPGAPSGVGWGLVPRRPCFGGYLKGGEGVTCL